MTQPLQLLDVPANGLLQISLIEVGGSHIVVGHSVLEHVIDDHQDRMRDCHHGFFVSPDAA